MNTGEQIICIDNSPHSYGDDLYWQESNFLIKYNIYTIKNINHYVKQRKEKVNIGFSLYEIDDIILDSNRFISVQEYRKQKLIKLNKCSK